MSRPRAKKKPLAEVVAIAGAERPEDALKRMHVLLASGSLKGVIVISLDLDGDVDTRLYGEFKRSDIAWAGHQLIHEAFE